MFFFSEVPPLSVILNHPISRFYFIDNLFVGGLLCLDLSVELSNFFGSFVVLFKDGKPVNLILDLNLLLYHPLWLIANQHVGHRLYQQDQVLEHHHDYQHLYEVTVYFGNQYLSLNLIDKLGLAIPELDFFYVFAVQILDFFQGVKVSLRLIVNGIILVPEVDVEKACDLLCVHIVEPVHEDAV